MTGVLILRPQPGADRTAERSSRAGLGSLIWPLFEITPCDWTIPDSGDETALLLTSANAARSMGQAPQSIAHLPAYCVGNATAEAARQGGFSVTFTGETNGQEVIDAMAEAGHRAAFHVQGEHVRSLDGPVSLTPIITYSSRFATIDLPSAETLASHIALLHSARAAERFAALVDTLERPRETIRIAAISAATLDSAGQGWRAMALAKLPNDAALIDAARSLAGD